jgi:hypothetical protein
MNDDSPTDPWKRLTDAARTAQIEPPSHAVKVPRAADFRMRVGTLLRLILWRRSSVWLAAIASLAWLVVLLVSRCDAPPEPLIPIPPETQPPL